jgi:hypothetical protein
MAQAAIREEPHEADVRGVGCDFGVLPNSRKKLCHLGAAGFRLQIEAAVMFVANSNECGM